PNATARIGRLMLRRGDWNGRQILSAAVVRQATRWAGLPNASGLGWWVNRRPEGGRKWPAAPDDAFWGAGAGHQFLLVVPSLNLIVVRNGGALDKSDDFDWALESYIVNPVMVALSARPRIRIGAPANSVSSAEAERLRDLSPASAGETASSRARPKWPAASGPEGSRSAQSSPAEPAACSSAGAAAGGQAGPSRRGPANGDGAPYPPSPVIREIRWAPAASIVRLGQDSDCWPLTWGDDADLYTAYGDGAGFDPKVPEKLSMGLAKVTGSPPGIVGVNIRSSTGEAKGDGPAGKKASGILMVAGVLYLWARNAGNSQLAWSTDHGATWSWAPWRFTTSFGCPAFVNFGRNYQGARDGYVYVVSPDSETAYVPADCMVMARVPKGRIAELDAYEFFRGLSRAGRPLWTRDIAQRGAVFTNPGRCLRSQISYDAPLKRYLWWQQTPGAGKNPADTRFKGGFGVYDAPEPWGPWTTAYFTELWDVGPGESASFPTKWMSADGTRLHMAFSGGDSLAVRAATLVPR
ncbi:MAG TPA: hypothetical protein VKT77_15460, partial [Chthonomonadaceae bacterium]|nr:hypothetical protein [Chthonomonadaceae bacterium]